MLLSMMLIWSFFFFFFMTTDNRYLLISPVIYCFLTNRNADTKIPASLDENW